MEVLSTGATSTVTTCSPSGLSAAFSAVQPDKSDMKHNNAMILTMKLCTILERSCHRLQCRQRDAISSLRIVVSVARLNQGILRIDHFQRGGFAGLVSQIDQAQALCRIIRSAPEAIDCRACRQRLVVKQIKISEQLPLDLSQLDPRLLLPRLRLTDFAAPYPPVKNRQGEVSDNVITGIRQRTGLWKRRNPTVQRKRIRLDAIVPIDCQRRKQRILRDADILSRLPKRFLGHTQLRILASGHGFNLRKWR